MILLMITGAIAILGLCLGSFVNALVWRLHQFSLPKKKRVAKDADLSLAKGRSMCPDCQHTLAWYDLVPLFSWLTLRGKCRYCHKPISWQYPLVELLTAVLFIVSYLKWPLTLHTFAAQAAFMLWLLILTGLIALLIYDLRWMILPTKLIYGLWPLVAAYIILHSLTQPQSIHVLLGAAFGAVILGGLFYGLITISEKWIGAGDVRLGFLLGALAGSPAKTLLLLFLASLLGSLLSLPMLLAKRFNMRSKLAFGPLLIIATIIVTLFGQSIINWYLRFFMVA